MMRALLSMLLAGSACAAELTISQMVDAALAGAVTPFIEQPGGGGGGTGTYPIDAPCPYNYRDCPIACGACGFVEDEEYYTCVHFRGYLGCVELVTVPNFPCLVKKTCTNVWCSSAEGIPPQIFERCTYTCYGPLACNWPALPAKLPTLGDAPCEDARWNEYLIARVLREKAYIQAVKTGCSMYINPTFLDGTPTPVHCTTDATGKTLPYYDCSCMDLKWQLLLDDLDALYKAYLHDWWCICHPSTPTFPTDPEVAIPRTVCPEWCAPVCCTNYNAERDIINTTFIQELEAAGCNPTLQEEAYAHFVASEAANVQTLANCCYEHAQN